MQRRFGAVLAIALLTAACTGSDSAEKSSPTAAPAAPTTTTTSAPGAVDIFELVSESIAYVETDVGSGSGILIEPGTLLTAAHVVWPQHDVRVVFPNGASTATATVIGTDLMADLALVDVSRISRLPQPVTLGDGESLPIGSTVYMVGYPAEMERNPTPTISQGILSRLREWESEGWTFLQSDATVVGGQSGGALVDEHGNVIGITNFHLATEYGLSGSILDVEDRIEAMKTGASGSDFGDRLPPELGGADSHRIEIEHFWDQEVFAFQVPLYTEVEVSTNGDPDTAIEIMTVDGLELAYADENTGGGETVAAQTYLPGPHLVVVTSWAADTVSDLITSTVDLIPWSDPDDGRTLERSSQIHGNIDFPGDIDWYWIALGQGQSITVEVDTVTSDPAIHIDALDNLTEFSLAFDDDSGGGPFGTNPRLVYTAEEFGTHMVIVSDSLRTGPGGYTLIVD